MANGNSLAKVAAVGDTALSVPTRSVMELLIDLAKDPQVDVVKINALITENERVMAIQAKVAFDAAFADMQAEIPTIPKRGRIKTDHGDRPYVLLADIERVMRPIRGRHGFSLRFRHRPSENGAIVVTGTLTHRAGHSETDEFESKPDDGGKMNSIQRIGSLRSYGQRYVGISLQNLTSAVEDDDDGEGAALPSPDREDAPQRRTVPPARQPVASDGEKVTPKQLARLYAITENSGRSVAAVKSWLRGAYGYSSSKAILRRDYEAIVAAIQAEGDLPGGAR